MNHVRCGVVIGLLFLGGCETRSGPDGNSDARNAPGVLEPAFSPTVPAGRVSVAGVSPDAVQFNDGVIAAALRFLSLVAADSADVSHDVEAIGAPFMVDGRQILKTSSELKQFVAGLRTKRKENSGRLSVLGVQAAPPGTPSDTLQVWFGPGVNTERAVELVSHATSHNAWLVQLTVARVSGGRIKTEDILIAVARTADREWFVAGFMD